MKINPIHCEIGFFKRWKVTMSILKKYSKKLNIDIFIVLYSASAMMMPNIFLFNIYNQNRVLVQIMLNHVLTLAVILAATSFVLLILMKYVLRSYEGSFLLICLLWILFWFYESFFLILPTDSELFYVVLIILSLFFLMLMLRLFSQKIQKTYIVLKGIAGVIALLFIFNTMPIFLSMSNNELRTATIRQSFEVDSSLPNPDIYWLHVDGMLAFDTIEEFFHAPVELREQLKSRGFMVNRDARFIAYNTYFGVPALLSPDFYDSYLQELFMEGKYWLRWYRSELLHSALERDSISFASDIAPYHELFHAFMQADYTTVMIAALDPLVYVPIDQFYRLDNDDYPFTIRNGALGGFLFDAINLIELLSLMTPISTNFVANVREGQGMLEWMPIDSHYEMINALTENTRNFSHERQLYRALIDTFSITEPKFVFVDMMFTHPTNWYLHDEYYYEYYGYYYDRIDLYPLAHDYAKIVIHQMIDMILYRNPDAVIVIQSDHGFHTEWTQIALLDLGLTAEEVINLHDSVMSAVRIPEVYGGLDAPLDPLNITRELVNRFVGRNYDLLQ